MRSPLCDDRCAAILIRCASPPDNVVAGCPSRRYPSPISSSTCSRRNTFGELPKKVRASRTVRSSTCVIERFLYLTSSTDALKRRPSHCSHGTNTSARNCISTRTSPSPSHASQRPPGTLNEKWLAVRPRDRASLVAANSSRIGSNAFRYVTGFDLGALQRGVDDVVHERALSRSTDSGDAGQESERHLDVDILEVVLSRTEDAN